MLHDIVGRRGHKDIYEKLRYIAQDIEVMMLERWNDEKIKAGKPMSIYVQEEQSQSFPGLSSSKANLKLPQAYNLCDIPSKHEVCLRNVCEFPHCICRGSFEWRLTMEVDVYVS